MGKEREWKRTVDGFWAMTLAKEMEKGKKRMEIEKVAKKLLFEFLLQRKKNALHEKYGEFETCVHAGKELVLNNNHVQEAMFFALISFLYLARAKEFTHFSLSNFAIRSEKFAKSLALALSFLLKRGKLFSISLRNVSIGVNPVVLNAFVKNLSGGALTCLNLMHNSIGKQGVHSILALISKFPSLTHLNLASNGLGSFNTHLISKATKNLPYLNLRLN